MRVLAAGLALLALAAPASAAQTLRVARPVARACDAAPAAGGTAHRQLIAPAGGVVRARLRGSGGDWDLAVFSGRRLVAGSASFGARELAVGRVARGERLLVQACRVRGAGAHARLSVSFDAVHERPQDGPTSLVRVAASAGRLSALGLDLAESGGAGGIDVVLHGNRDAGLLRASGLRFRTLVGDLAAPRAEPRVAGAPGSLPSGRTSYRDYADYGTDMAALAAARPDLVRPISIGHSLDGQEVDGLEITSGVNARDGKPVFLLLGEHHAREWPSAEEPLEFAWDLVHSYDRDPRVHQLVDSVRTIVVPIVNPDGFVISRTGVNDSKRKNCRVPSGACGDSSNADQGVDPNRNYGGFWGGPGASTNPLDETFRGSGPFSEPETQNVRALIASHQVAVLISNHTSGGLVLRPPGVSGDPPAPDEPALKSLGDQMAGELGYTSEMDYQLYDESGTTEDWAYYTGGAFSYTFEIWPSPGDFHPDFQTAVVGSYPALRKAYLDAMTVAADPAQHAQLTGSAPAGRVLRLHKEVVTSTSIAGMTFPDTLDSTMVVPASGAFTWDVNPSTRPGAPTEAWRLTCEAGDGTVLQAQDVVIGRGQRLSVAPCPPEATTAASGDGGANGTTPAAPSTGSPAPPSHGVPNAPAPLTSAKTLSLRISPTSVRTARARGVAVRVSCPRRCTLTLSLRAGTRTVGRTVAKRVLGTHTIRVRLRTHDRRVTLVATATGGVHQTLRRALRLA